MTKGKSETIYVYLLGEGTDAWRPVEAVQTSENVYRITSTPIKGESWQFKTGDLVRCREKFSVENKPFLEAFEVVLDEPSH